MTPAARIQAVIEILGEILQTPRPADTLTSAYFRNRRYIGSKDRQDISKRLYRILRHYHRLNWWIEHSGCQTDPALLVIADLVLEEQHTLTTLDALFSGAPYAPSPLKRHEKQLATALRDQSLHPQEMPLQKKLECPDWAFQPLQKELGHRFEQEMNAMLQPAPLDIRVNSLKASRDEVAEQLEQDGLDVEIGTISPLALRLRGRPPIAQHPLFKEGAIEIQDQGSQMVAFVANAKPGEQVVDFCAGAGGKTLALGAMMNNKGRIVAMDVLGGRLMRAKERFRRAGLHNVETRELSSERDKFVKRHVGHFDLVLVDAPCTGTGTWRRDPDKRWRSLGPGLGELVPLQQKILESAARMVKPGGRLVYATCSLLHDENAGQIDNFLKQHKDFEVLPVDSFVKNIGTGPYLQLTPAQHDTDGFFAACLVRKSGDSRHAV